MYLHRFTIDRQARRPRPGVLHNKTHHFHIRPHEDAETELVAVDFQTVLRKPKPEFSIRFHVGTGASSTPFDGHLTILGSGIYWGITAGRRVAGWITRESAHRYEGRDLAVDLTRGRLSWKFWTHPDSWTLGEFAKWRDRGVALWRPRAPL
jgi:hypothetical protein